METIEGLRKMDIQPISFICDNCPLNQGVYRLLGGPGKVEVCGVNTVVTPDHQYAYSLSHDDVIIKISHC